MRATMPIGMTPLDVASLPLPTPALTGTQAFVTDAAEPIVAFEEVVGGGSTKCPIFCDGTAWVHIMTSPE